MAKLTVGFILAQRFTLCAFANFVDVLRLSADEGDRSRPILCGWKVLSPTMDPIVSSCGIVVQPEERLGEPGEYQKELKVYGRKGEPCRRCRTPIESVRISNRTAYYCPQCQS